MTKLKPCSFCGGEAEIVVKAGYQTSGWGKTYYAHFCQCKKCGARSKAFNDIDNPRDYIELAINSWNKIVGDTE